MALGKALRAEVPRSRHAEHVVTDRDPLAILQAQNATRLPELIDLRMQRMTSNPFAFYRGTAAIMAADLADDPHTGISIVSCGDAHITNFGLYASPQRTLLFDLNDFDEANEAPWEWDVKRLVTSVVVAARDAGYGEAVERATALTAARAYRESMQQMMTLPVIERFYRSAAIKSLRKRTSGEAREMIDRAVAQARKRTSDHAISRMTELDADGVRRFVDAPPLLTRLTDDEQAQLLHLFDDYRSTVSPDIALLLSQYDITDIALRVVGVGSVGTRCYVLVLTGPAGDALILQVKEAETSALESWGGHPDAAHSHHGARVVDNQRILQAISDPFLGYITGPTGRHFYVRQFRDMKGAVELAGLAPTPFEAYVSECGSVLGRAHAQSPQAPAMAGYLGSSSVFDHAVVEWSLAYADQSARDFRQVTEQL
ncbi:DUF2252 domain-containing protein [Leifsonia sp. AK011]|uniref:DUF2252 domain-containing protein n=1 Tax=Leifsonia sp. AK011 TaxID=2723075 RepID=UPI0035B5E481